MIHHFHFNSNPPVQQRNISVASNLYSSCGWRAGGGLHCQGAAEAEIQGGKEMEGTLRGPGEEAILGRCWQDKGEREENCDYWEWCFQLTATLWCRHLISLSSWDTGRRHLISTGYKMDQMDQIDLSLLPLSSSHLVTIVLWRCGFPLNACQSAAQSGREEKLYEKWLKLMIETDAKTQQFFHYG